MLLRRGGCCRSSKKLAMADNLPKAGSERTVDIDKSQPDLWEASVEMVGSSRGCDEIV